ncbi:MAG: ligase [Firmicutes bacterium]|nr:ligase [Bacillota bacterium]
MIQFQYEGSLVPVYSWTKEIEATAKEQIEHLAKLPFAYHHIAVMPDCHSGYGMPIGGVLAADNVIVPNAVGVDIGCGMIAVKTTLRDIAEEQIKQVIGKARAVIPVGFNHHKKKQENPVFDLVPDVEIIHIELESARHQIGTLGSGNHFVEIQKGDDGFVWLMIHSGSRNIGKKVCDHYNQIAVGLNSRWKTPVPAQWELAYLPVDTPQGNEYLRAMEFCLRFAKANRALMMQRLKEIVFEVVGGAQQGEEICTHHNYAAWEEHYGKRVLVHRKGAIRMFKGDVGIIPGSMGTPSYIVEGLGNPEAFMSASHGAGRKMSRAEADKTISEEQANKAMAGVVFGRWSRDRKGRLDVSECPLAYKDIEEVIQQELDLIKTLVKLQPLGVLKG